MTEPSSFLARALAEAARYGQDEWVFVRELAQNARDAGAGRVTVTTGADGGEEWVSVADDGAGMSFAHARRFFFRLYASSKEEDRDAAGRFGVGFWSVLRWQPTRIEVESRTATEVWARSFTGELVEREAVPTLASPGTRITLRRPRRSVEVGAGASAALTRYCRFLRRAGRPAPLPVVCDGVELNQPFTLDPPSLSFSTADAEGVVGLGADPRVELWARGLFVTEVALLDELDPDRSVPAAERRAGGLAPVVLLHSDRLELLLSRQAARRGRVLRRMLRLARGRVDRLVRHVLDGAAPQPLWERLAEGLRRPLSRFRSWHALVGALSLTLALVAALLLRTVSEARDWAPPRVAPPSITVRAEPLPVPDERPLVPSLLPYTQLADYGGAIVEVPDGHAPPWGLRYEGASEVLFRLAALERYDPERGFVAAPSAKSEHPEHQCARDCVRVHLEVIAPRGPLAVPVPTGHRLVPSSLRLDGGPRPKVSIDAAGDAFVELPPGLAGVLTYQTGPYAGRRPALAPVPVTLPDWALRAVERSARQPPVRRAAVLTAAVRAALVYDASPVTAAAFRAARGDWLARVLTTGAGDCDVKNGVNVLLLRRAGIPARLAMGIVGRDGGARPNLHAWTEYYAGRWRVADATGSAPPPWRGPPPPSVASAVEPEPPAAWRESPAPAPGSALVAPGFAPAARAPDPTGSVTAAPPGRGAPSLFAWLPWAARLGAAGGVGLTALLLVIAWRRRVREELSGDDPAATRRALAGMVRDALAHPTVWRENASLWQRRLLPTLGGRPLSVVEALTRAGDGRLFVSRQHSALARLAAARGAPVLDGAEPVFAEAIAALGRAIDLDELDRLRPVADGEPLVAALAPINACLRRAGLDARCLLCAGLGAAALRDVDLTGLGLPPDHPLPRRFVALNPDSPLVQRRLAFVARQPHHGVLLWLDWLADYSQLLLLDAARLREQAALELLEAWR